MKVVTNRQKIVGTLSTLVGRFPMLELMPLSKFAVPNKDLRDIGTMAFSVLDDEGFDTIVYFHGDFAIIPASVVVEVDVRHVLTQDEEAKLTIPVEQFSVVE